MIENQDQILKELEKARKLNVTSPHEGEIALRRLLKLDHTLREDLQIKIALAYSLYSQTKHQDAFKLYDEVLEKAINHNFQEEMGDAHLGKGSCYIYLGKIDKGISQCLQAIKIFKELSLTEKLSRVHNVLGSLYFNKGDFDLSLECYNKSMKLTKNKNTIMYTMALGNSALIYLLRGEMEKSAKFSRLSIKKAKALNFYRGICAFESNLSDALRAMGEYSKALKHLKSGLQLSKEKNFIANTASMSVSFANYWIDLGELKKGYQMLNNALAIYEDFYDPQGKILTLESLATYWLIQGQFNKARRSLEDALNLIEKSGVSESKIEILTLLTEINEGMDKTDDAYIYLKQADKLSRERSSEIGHTRVLIQRGRINLNKLEFNEAEMFLEEALWHSEKIQHIVLQFTCKMLLAQNYLVKYLQKSSDLNSYNKAISFISEAMELAKTKKLIPNYINALIIRGLLHSSQDEQEEAEQTLNEAIDLAQKHEMILKSRDVQEKLLVISAKKASNSPKSQLNNIVLNYALEELKTTTVTYVENAITEDDLADTFFVSFKIDEKLGPVILQKENVKSNGFAWNKNILMIGSLYSVTLGQGLQYHEGLFGPLPFGDKKLRSLIYTLIIDDPSQLEKRTHKQSYVLLCLVFRKNLGPFFYDRQKVKEIFDNQVQTLESIEYITEEFLEYLRKKILSEIMEELV
ncbi:MAG: hypothetical protein ACTSWX_05675 [Promethearchaeota archaeon]